MPGKVPGGTKCLGVRNLSRIIVNRNFNSFGPSCDKQSTIFHPIAPWVVPRDGRGVKLDPAAALAAAAAADAKGNSAAARQSQYHDTDCKPR